MLKETLLCKGFSEGILAVVAAVALMVTTISVHTCCWFILGQDRLPEHAGKLRRF